MTNVIAPGRIRPSRVGFALQAEAETRNISSGASRDLPALTSPLEGLEPPTSSSEAKRSIHWATGAKF